MGTAIIADQGLFEPRDFSQTRVSPKRGIDGFVGYFASLNEVNHFLRSKPDSGSGKRNSHRILSTMA